MGQDLSMESLAYLAPGPVGSAALLSQHSEYNQEQQSPQQKSRRHPLEDMNNSSNNNSSKHRACGLRVVPSSPSDAPTTSPQVRVIMVGAQVHSQEHFSSWLDSPEDPMKRMRSPGRHYTSLSRAANARSQNMSSEGNRFILDDEL
jgi:hypothetical protein